MRRNVVVVTLVPHARPTTTSSVLAASVAGHRGASGHRPEHTLEAYRHALALGADAIEVDVVSTADGVLVARHESELSATTDVARRADLAHLRSERVVAGRRVTGWFVEDLTLEEVRTLRARERWPLQRPASGAYDGLLAVPTLEEVLALAAEQSRSPGRAVGVLVELKDAARSARRGLDLTAPLLAGLRRHGLDRADSPVSVMGFEPSVLASLAGRTRVPLVQLVCLAWNKLAKTLSWPWEGIKQDQYGFRLPTAASTASNQHMAWFPIRELLDYIQ